MAHSEITDMSGFELGAPALICRWRLSHGHLPLTNRHMRALLARIVNGQRVTTELVAWAKQHIEWTLQQGSAEYPDGTLMLIVDTQGKAAMTVGSYLPLEDVSVQGLTRRAQRAADEGAKTGVAPETLWLVQGDTLIWDQGEDCTASGAASLIVQLAKTLGIDVIRYEGLIEAVRAKDIPYDEVFLVSDEHGVVPAIDATGVHGQRLAQGYQRLLERS